MNPLHVVIDLVLIGWGLWMLNVHIPMQPPFKQVINIIAFIMTALWLLNGFGLFHLSN